MLLRHMRNIVFQALAEAARNSESVALGIITGVKGSSPQKVGAKALFYADGRLKGTLGGGCLEAEIQYRAVQSLRTGQAATFDLLLDHDFGWDDGLMCGGKVCGLILPNAEQAGAEFWTELAERKQTTAWGVKGDFSITSVSPSGSLEKPPGLGVRQPPGALETAEKPDEAQKHQSTGALQDASEPDAAAGDWLYQETVTAPCALWIAGA